MSAGILLVTGGASGIGLETARLWQQRGGVSVALDVCDVPKDAATCALACDVRSEVEVRTAIAKVWDRFGRLDAVFHNAGVLGPEASLTELSLSDWEACLRANLTGAFLVARETVPLLVQSAPSSLLFNASIAALRGASRYPGYAAAKAGLLSLVRSLAVPLARKGVRVNAICPGSVPGTQLLARSRGAAATAGEIADLIAQLPLQRTTKVKDVAELALFLVSSGAPTITGTVVPIDGGERFV